MSDATPRFNHVAMSVPASLLDASSRADLLAFYGEVFDWTEMPSMSRDGELLVLRAHRNDQFVFLHADPDPMICPKLDHVGFAVDTPAAFEAFVSRALASTERFEGVEIQREPTQDFGVLQLHSCYVRYRLPLQFEIQCFDWKPGFDADSLPSD